MLNRFGKGGSDLHYSFTTLWVVGLVALAAGYSMHSVWLSSLSREREIFALTKDVANLENRLVFLRDQTQKSAEELKAVQDLIATQRDLKKRLAEVTKPRVRLVDSNDSTCKQAGCLICIWFPFSPRCLRCLTFQPSLLEAQKTRRASPRLLWLQLDPWGSIVKPSGVGKRSCSMA
jgi:hypothetical protein